MIVRRDDNERHLFDSGDVHSFVERPPVCMPPSPMHDKPAKFFSPRESFRHQRAHRHRDHRSEVD